MTNSQNIKNEQQNDLCITSEQLTEEWKKGELPNGYYYCKLKINDMQPSIERCKSHCIAMGVSADFGEEVLAEVPTYEEYLALQSDSIAKNEGAEIVAELEAKVKQLKKDYKDLEFKFRSYKDFKETVYDLDTSRLEEENTKLKELLKECDNMNTRLQNALWQWNEDSGLYEECDELEEKIREVLK